MSRGAEADAAEIELIPFADLESRRELWGELARRSGNPFATWEWADVWWRHFAADATPAFFECRREDRTFAILPLYLARRGPLRFLRLIGHGPGDVLGPICDPADAGLAGLALQRALEANRKPRLLLAERLPGGPLTSACGGRVLNRESNPRLETGGVAWEDYLATRSRNLREKLRRSTRKLEREHEVAYSLCEDADRLQADLDSLFLLHRDRWGDGGAFTREAVIAFHRELATAMLECGRLRLWKMTVDDEPVAAWYGFRYGAGEFFYQSGRNRDYDRYSIGFLMLTRTIRAAFDDGLDHYSFLRGDEPYKDRFANADDGLETHVLGRGPIATMTIGVGAVSLRSQLVRRRATAALG